MIVESKLNPVKLLELEKLLEEKAISTYYLVNTDTTRVYVIRLKEAYIFLNLDMPSSYGEVTFASNKEEIAKKALNWIEEFRNDLVEKQKLFYWLLVEEEEFKRPLKRSFEKIINSVNKVINQEAASKLGPKTDHKQAKKDLQGIS